MQSSFKTNHQETNYKKKYQKTKKNPTIRTGMRQIILSHDMLKLEMSLLRKLCRNLENTNYFCKFMIGIIKLLVHKELPVFNLLMMDHCVRICCFCWNIPFVFPLFRVFMLSEPFCVWICSVFFIGYSTS
jgi:hypothetical protein